MTVEHKVYIIYFPENKLEKEKMAAESTPQFVPEPRQLAPEQDQQVHSSADKTVTVGTLQEEPTAHVPADQMSSVADLSEFSSTYQVKKCIP